MRVENKVQQFLNDNFGEVRVFTNDNKVWFCANDLMRILEYAEGSKRTKISRLPQKGVTKCNVLTNGGEQELNFVDEPNMYRLAMGSKMDKAEEFQDWICEEIIPTIRKTGGFVEDEREEEFINKYFPSFSDDVKLSMVQDLLKTNKKLKEKADGWDQFLDSNGTYNFTEVSKLISTKASDEGVDIKISVVKLTEFLRSEKVLSSTKSKTNSGKEHYKNLPNKEYEDYFNVSSVDTNGGFRTTQTRVKASGVKMIYELVKSKYTAS